VFFNCNKLMFPINTKIILNKIIKKDIQIHEYIK
jgi:hypothetical protein